MKRPEMTQSGHTAPVMFNDHEMKSEYPTLHDYLACEVWEDGKHRKTSTLLLFVDEGSLKLCLNDRALLRQAFISARTLTEALSLLEDGLYSDSIIWRANKPNQKK